MGFKSFRGAMRSVGLPIPKTFRGAMRQAGAPIPTIGAILKGGRGSGHHHLGQSAADCPSDAWDPNYTAQCGACGWVVIPRGVATHSGPYLCCGHCNAWMGPAPVMSSRPWYEDSSILTWVIVGAVCFCGVTALVVACFWGALGPR